MGNVSSFEEWGGRGGWCGRVGEEADVDDFIVETYDLTCWKEGGEGMENDVLIGVDGYEGGSGGRVREGENAALFVLV